MRHGNEFENKECMERAWDQKDPTSVVFFASSLEAYVHFWYSRGREMTSTQAIFQQRYGFSLSHRASKDILLA